MSSLCSLSDVWSLGQSESPTSKPVMRDIVAAALKNANTVNDNRVFNIVLEGNIAAGKSTLIELLRPHGDVITVMEEPVAEWECVNGHNLLKMFYEEPSKYAFNLQVFISATMIHMASKDCSTKFKLIERSMYRLVNYLIFFLSN